MAEKLILPTEVKVCATCSFWDGERQVDPETQVVVVSGECQGECLVTETSKNCLNHISCEEDCLWEDLVPDESSEPKTAS